MNQDPLGGNNYIAGSFEFGFPIGFLEEAGISGALFLDYGSVWGLDDTNGAGGPGSVDDSFSLRSVIGLTLFWETALGPLAFNFTETLSSEDYERRPFLRHHLLDAFLTMRFAIGLGLALALIAAGPAGAQIVQPESPQPTQVLTIDPERLFEGTALWPPGRARD